MAKIRKCSHKDCEDLRMKRPGNTSIFFKFCQDHQIKAVLSKKRVQQHKYKQGLENMRKTKNKRTTKDKFYQSTAWKYFSHYVLLKYADDNLDVRCSTNPVLQYRVNDRNICVGHWQKVFDANSTNYSTAFMFVNVAPQSVQENVHTGGNMDKMAKFIDSTHGIGTCDMILMKRRESLKLDKSYLDEIAKKYKKLFKDELNKRNISDPWN